MSPYYNTDIITFFYVLVQRLMKFATGQIGFDQVASDEIQLFVLIALGISSALVGAFLIFRKMTMLANSLSHTILLGIIIAFLFTSQHSFEGQIPLNLLLAAAVGIGFITTAITEFLTKTGKLQEDASIGLVFTSFFALGIVLVSLLTRNVHIGAEIVMGNVDALHKDDMRLAGIILIINLLAIYIFINGWKLTTFDPNYARVLGFSPQIFNYLLMVLVSLTIVGAFRAVGVLMVLTFITAPALLARLFCHKLSTLLMVAALLASLGSLLGVAISRHLLTVYGIALSTAGVVVTLLGSTYIIAACFKGLLNQISSTKKAEEQTADKLS